MSFTDDPNDQLQKLLKCKRYEQPPPGYFLSFSDKVIARIEMEDALESTSWWTWLMNRFDARPVLVCAYGLAVSSLLLIGVRLSQAFDAEVAGAPSVSGPWLASGPASPLLSEGLTRTGLMGTAPSSSAVSSKLFFREEPTQFLLPGNGLRVQTAGFAAGSW